MSLLSLILVIALVAVIVWAITTFIPMDPRFKTLIYVVAIIIILVFLLQSFGLIGGSVKLTG
jgi:predicted membrane metal-binding protein